MRTVFLLAVLGFCQPAAGYDAADRWIVTATDGATGPTGTPVTLTWSIVPDGTVLPNVLPNMSPPVNRNSELVSAFDALFNETGGGDYTTRTWFAVLESAFERWEEISGVEFVYEPEDDGRIHGTWSGDLGVRGDIRVGGALIDGTAGENVGTLAYSFFPDTADLVFDTHDTGYYGNPETNYLRFRHTAMHEIGHSLGLAHVLSAQANILLEAFPQSNFDGPQLDDILGAQHLYGDALERGAGNNSLAATTVLGVIGESSPVSIGEDAANGLEVTIDEVDFVSISSASDLDFYSFSVDSAGELDVVLSPAGATYRYLNFTTNVSSEVVASSIGDLQLQLWESGPSPTLIASANLGGVGAAEELLGIEVVPGTEYALRVSAATDDVQLYQLDVSLDAFLEGDYNHDGLVDLADFSVWRDTLGSESLLSADGDSSGKVGIEDYLIWREHFGDSDLPAIGGLALAGHAPEPGSLGIAAVGALLWVLGAVGGHRGFCLELSI